MTTTTATDLGALLTRVRAGREFGANVYSTLDVLQVLYDRVLRITPATVSDPDRDRFLLSKGHAVAGYYALLAARGFLPPEWLDDQGGPASRLGDHPDRTLVPGVEIGSGSLGHGLGLGVGTALGLRAQGRTGPRVYVLLGDAELDEGSNHEAIAYAFATGLGNLTAIVLDNRSATYGWPGGAASRFTVNGWSAATVDGRDHGALHAALTGHDDHRPHVVVAVVTDGE
ncbi:MULTISPECIES: transketolase [unclassified Micromonospora]|uniref:transketolase n=1 Tax=unclassified Micromonospora TaxID=2617518 RepID=UPI001C244493|nr:MULTISPECIES: transketolase [unclassified Micromonospora]MBU8857825.1 transketolase [Micromonospora sp. WMMB482]MDM4783456.1 transketolase [Micromonospora sp. b486]